MDLKVLVIDDEFADEIAERLRLAHPAWHVDLARGIRSADRKLRDNQFDAVVIDMRMDPNRDDTVEATLDVTRIAPESAGLAVLKMLSGLETRPAAIVLTAFGSPTNIVKAMQLGADAFLKKDDVLKLPEQVTNAVDRRVAFHHDPRLPRMLEKARAVQVGSQPEQASSEGITIAGANLPAMRLSGDSFFFTDFASDHKTRFMLCDAEDKGPYAALLAGTLYSIFRLGIDSAWPLEKIDATLHLATMRLTSESSFATGVIGEFDARTKNLDFISAGHDPAILAGNGTAAFVGLDDKRGLPWGLTDGDGLRAAPARDVVHLAEQHSLLFYSDGVPDVLSQASGGHYGKDELLQSHRVCNGKDAAEVCESIVFSALDFGGLVSLLIDDMTVIAIHRSR